MRRRPLFAALVLLLVAACAAQDRLVPADAYLADVTWLADDARQGRDTGSEGLAEASRWVIAQFEAAGLEPAGDDGGWEQRFEVKGNRRLLDGNQLVLGGRELRLASDWNPLQTAITGSAQAPVVFAGYGISDPEGGWDDYAGLDVTGRIVLVLRRGPRSEEAGTRYAEGEDARRHISFAAKINAAYRHGAAALLVVNVPAPARAGDEPESDRPQRYMPLGLGDPEGGDLAASLPAASITAAAAQEALAGHGVDLLALRSDVDGAWRAGGRVLDGVEAALEVRSELQTIAAANVLGWLPGTDPALAGEHVVIGAHMDHVGLGEGRGGRGGREARGQVHNGADDNASGTAGLVGVARVLGARRGDLRRGVLFAAWSAEEKGLLGSVHYVKHPARPLDDLVAMINMDMIGRSKDGYVAIEGVGSSPVFRDLVVEAHDELHLGLDLHLADKPSNNSDQWPFFEAGVPVLAFFTGLHDDYHMPTDDADKINADAGARIASLAGQVVATLASAAQRPEFSRPGGGAAVAAAAPADPHAGGPGAGDQPVQAYGVVLGTSPDMTYQQEDGVKLASVREGTPAKRAGLRKGDLIVTFDGKPVKNLEDYSVLLFSHKPGDVVSIGVLRDGTTLVLQAKLEGKVGEN